MAVNQLGHFNFPTFEIFLRTVSAHLEASLKAQNYELQLNKEQQLTYLHTDLDQSVRVVKGFVFYGVTFDLSSAHF